MASWGARSTLSTSDGAPWRGAPAVFGGGVINMTKRTRDGLGARQHCARARLIAGALGTALTDALTRAGRIDVKSPAWHPQGFPGRTGLGA
jgi:hypothetical protein